MEIIAKDLAARIASFKTAHGKVETPALFPVMHAKGQPVPMAEIKEMGAPGIITNAYMLWKRHRAEALEKGVHRLLGWDKTIMTDSGAFQLMQYRGIDVDNRTIIQFQKDIGVDIGVILDVPGIGPREQMEKNLSTTLSRARELEQDSRIWCGPIQGGEFQDLRRKSCREMKKIGFRYYALGSVVPLMNDYRFAENIDLLAAARQELPLNVPLHHFGGGHPMFFAFAVAMGADIFDSAAYSLFAKRGNYMTTSGTQPISKMAYLPCSCPACRGKEPSDLTSGDIARHNLYASFNEINKIKQAIREQTLWELLEERARGHPALYGAFLRMKKHRSYIEPLDPYTKKRFFYLSRESLNRSELYRHSHNNISSKEYVDAFPFKKVPCEITDRYPFGQRELPENSDIVPSGSPLERANALAEYQFGIKLFPRGSVVRVARTGRIRTVASNGKILASFRSGDLVCIPHGAARTLHKKTKSWRVVVDQETAEFPAKGLNAFAKFVIGADPKIRAGMEVLVVDEGGALLAEGQALLSAREMLDFDEGVAVKVRKGFGT